MAFVPHYRLFYKYVMTIYLRSILFGWAIGYSQGSTDKVILYINNQESRDRPDYFFDPVVPTVSKLFFGNTAILKGKVLTSGQKKKVVRHDY